MITEQYTAPGYGKCVMQYVLQISDMDTKMFVDRVTGA